MDQGKQNLEKSISAVKQALTQLRRHTAAVVVGSLLLSAVGIVGIALMPNMYVATTTILVDPQKIPERYVATTVTSDPSSRLNALTQLVLSATRLQEIMNRANLYPDQRRKRSREELLDYVRSKIKIEVKSGSEQGLSSFTISYEDSDRFIVAPMANQLAASFINWNLKVRGQQALGTSQFLSSELQQTKKSLEEQETRLKAFRVSHAGETPEELSGNLQALSALQTQLQSSLDATSRLDEERILLTQTTKPADTRDIGVLSERGRLLQQKNRLSNQLWELKQQFTDTYPDVAAVAAQLKAVNARLAELPEPTSGATDSLDNNTRVRLDLINKDLLRHKQQQVELQRKMNEYQSKVEAVPALQMQLAELTRNYEASKQNYQSLLDKSFSAGMAQDLESRQEAERFTALDTAQTPEKPFKPKRLPLMAAAVLVSILLSLGVAVGLGMISGSIQSEAALRELLPLKIVIVGTIPPITSIADKQHSRFVFLGTAAVSVAICVAVAMFLMKVRPIL
jgi:succinoglycan biosynthesis transport protein ExoP